MTRTTDNVWLSRFALLTALATLVLICFGGLVTSHEAGMAVPDWPNTFGYNLFFFPVSKWVGGIFYEHTHRLVASGVGFLTIILAVWLWLKESRRWLRWLGVIALFSVVLQGVLGGLRVVLFKDELGIFHADLGQLFFVLTCSIALFTSRWWLLTGPPGEGIHRRQVPHPVTFLVNTPSSLRATLADHCDLRRLFLFTTILILAQLVLGATMRHQHAGVAIPDFPAAYGRVWPALDAESIARYNQNRVEVNAANPITAFQIVLQMTHRILALAILLLVAGSACLANCRLGRDHLVAKVSGAWLGLILVQVFLGAATIWTGKSADVATAHVAFGALSLATGAMLAILGFRCLVSRSKRKRIQGLTPAIDDHEQVRTGARTAMSARSARESLNHANKAVGDPGQGFTKNGPGVASNLSG